MWKEGPFLDLGVFSVLLTRSKNMDDLDINSVLIVY